MRLCSTAAYASLVMLATGSLCLGQDRDTKVRNDRKQFEDDESWIYNDLPRAFELARGTGKPLLAVIRCIP